MHPAYSVIVFTTLSGAGYGLLFLLCLFGAAGVLPSERWLGFAGFALAFSLITVGLLASTFHLGHPERAWRAVTQWRSSWLSREGVVSLVTYVPAGVFAIGWVFFATTEGLWGAFGVAGAICAVLTVYCTGMIYASLKTIRQWHNEWVVPGYLVFAFATGALWLNALAHPFGAARPLFAWLAAVGLALGLAVKLGYWRAIDTERKGPSPGTATGLGRLGRVRQLESPHTQDNYLMREMGFRVARKHAHKLRRHALLGGFVAPLVLTLLSLPAEGILAGLLAVLAVLAATAGMLIERWLFFAEARHVVTLYYGAQEA
ncbi:MAG: dimethyl sulfoxide reductase anchor subunit family protein [Kiloniellaceae bacterium]